MGSGRRATTSGAAPLAGRFLLAAATTGLVVLVAAVNAQSCSRGPSALPPQDQCASCVQYDTGPTPGMLWCGFCEDACVAADPSSPSWAPANGSCDASVVSGGGWVAPNSDWTPAGPAPCHWVRFMVAVLDPDTQPPLERTGSAGLVIQFLACCVLLALLVYASRQQSRRQLVASGPKESALCPTWCGNTDSVTGPSWWAPLVMIGTGITAALKVAFLGVDMWAVFVNTTTAELDVTPVLYGLLGQYSPGLMRYGAECSNVAAAVGRVQLCRLLEDGGAVCLLFALFSVIFSCVYLLVGVRVLGVCDRCCGGALDAIGVSRKLLWLRNLNHAVVICSLGALLSWASGAWGALQSLNTHIMLYVSFWGWLTVLVLEVVLALLHLWIRAVPLAMPLNADSNDSVPPTEPRPDEAGNNDLNVRLNSQA